MLTASSSCGRQMLLLPTVSMCRAWAPPRFPGSPAPQTPRNRMLDESGGRRHERNIDRYANALHDNLYSGS